MTFEEDVTVVRNTFTENVTVSSNTFTSNNTVVRNEFTSNVTTQFPAESGGEFDSQAFSSAFNI